MEARRRQVETPVRRRPLQDDDAIYQHSGIIDSPFGPPDSGYGAARGWSRRRREGNDQNREDVVLDSLASKLSRLPLLLRVGVAFALLGVVPLAIWVMAPRGSVEAPAVSAPPASAVEATTSTSAPAAAVPAPTVAAPPAQATPQPPNWPLIWIAWGVWALAIGTAVLASFTYRLWRDAVRRS